jgi:hypothetical protein
MVDAYDPRGSAGQQSGGYVVVPGRHWLVESLLVPP